MVRSRLASSSGDNLRALSGDSGPTVKNGMVVPRLLERERCQDHRLVSPWVDMLGVCQPVGKRQANHATAQFRFIEDESPQGVKLARDVRRQLLIEDSKVELLIAAVL